MDKTHEKAIELGRKLIEKNPELTDWVISKFPELKESKENEDEKIRKEIINYIKNSTCQVGDKTYNSWISWLEKQGEPKPTWSEEDERTRRTNP